MEFGDQIRIFWTHTLCKISNSEHSTYIICRSCSSDTPDTHKSLSIYEGIFDLRFFQQLFIASNDRMINEWAGILGWFMAFASRDWGRPRKTQICIAGFRIEICTQNEPNKKRYCHKPDRDIPSPNVAARYHVFHYTRWFKYDRDWFVCKQAALRSSCATLREWSHNLHPPSCSG